MRLYKIAFCFIGLSLVSCEDFLSEVPDNRTQIDSEEKIQEVLVAAYPEADYAPFLEPMTDNVGDKGNLSETQDLYLKSYSWDVPIEEQQDTPISYWNAAYEAIAQANHALDAIDGMTDNEDLKAERGEALLARAYAHFMLVNIWAEHYDPATASTDLGIPYVDEPETVVIKDYERQSVEEVYDLIEKDLLEGLELIENNYLQPSYHFTPEAARAFATRFYLFKGDWQKVIEHSSSILANASDKIRDWNYYQDLQLDEVGPEVMSPAETSNLLIMIPVSGWSYDYFLSRFGLSVPKLQELFESDNPYGKGWSYPIVSYGDDLTYGVNKTDTDIFEFTDITAQIGFRRSAIALLTYDEVLLARAEAYAMQNDYDNALADINTFLPKKTVNYTSADVLSKSDIEQQQPNADEYVPYYELTSQQGSFIKFIAELRRREFHGEALRWFDIKRFHIPITHNFVNQNEDILTANDPRRLLQIPPTAISFGIQSNPR